jgi:hypothetical protein
MGPAGETGPAGPQGNQGDQGIQGPPGGAPSWQGEWSVSVDYASNDAVSLNGSSYYAVGDPAVGVSPPAAPWQQIAAKGDTGPQGATGATGPGVAAGGTTGQVLVKTSATDYATAWTTLFSSFTDIAEVARPANPAAGFLRLYAKADHGLYVLDSTGTERRLDITTLEGTTSYA